jgi:hypothetical protein
MSKPEHILRQEGSIKRPEFCTCDDGYWMRNLIDPGCHYHSDYADELREEIQRLRTEILQSLRVSQQQLQRAQDEIKLTGNERV